MGDDTRDADDWSVTEDEDDPDVFGANETDDVATTRTVGTEFEYGAGTDTDTDTAEHIDASKSDVVEMHCCLDVSDMSESDRAILHELAALFERNFSELVAKNRDYGFSFLTTGAKLSESDSFPSDNPSRAQVLGLLTRAGDKRERLIQNVYGDGGDAVSDPAHVTAREAANYWLFMAMVLKNPDLAASATDDDPL